MKTRYPNHQRSVKDEERNIQRAVWTYDDDDDDDDDGNSDCDGS